VHEDKLKKDPDNRLLARGPRIRMSAETIRDMALESSGLLVHDIGGPSVKVYQPKGIWESSTSGRGVLSRYVQDHGDNLYRRGLYNFIKRTVPPPGMLVFDASNRDQCEVNRMRTNTPLQALVIMNDPIMLESSRVFAERLTRTGGDPHENVSSAFRAILCRSAREKELSILTSYYDDELKVFQADPVKAKELIQVGEYKPIEGEDAATVAALMQVIHTIYNMEEAIMKN
jgi:hypothetical protein